MTKGPTLRTGTFTKKRDEWQAAKHSLGQHLASWSHWLLLGLENELVNFSCIIESSRGRKPQPKSLLSFFFFFFFLKWDLAEPIGSFANVLFTSIPYFFKRNLLKKTFFHVPAKSVFSHMYNIIGTPDGPVQLYRKHKNQLSETARNYSSNNQFWRDIER